MPAGVNEKLWREAKKAAGIEPSSNADPIVQKKYWGTVWKIYRAKAKKKGIPYKRKKAEITNKLIAIANKLDNENLFDEADEIDNVLLAIACLE